jgi:hypothetical protein
VLWSHHTRISIERCPVGHILEIAYMSETWPATARRRQRLRQENVTPGEVEAIHHDLNRLRHEMSELAVRVEMIEEREKAEH